jgi:Predicted AAA-ATPase
MQNFSLQRLLKLGLKPESFKIGNYAKTTIRLLISTLHYYYGVQYQNDFKVLFGHTSIGKNPTRRANQFLILRFDFSGISTATEQSSKKISPIFRLGLGIIIRQPLGKLVKGNLLFARFYCAI